VYRNIRSKDLLSLHLLEVVKSFHHYQLNRLTLFSSGDFCSFHYHEVMTSNMHCILQSITLHLCCSLHLLYLRTLWKLRSLLDLHSPPTLSLLIFSFGEAVLLGLDDASGCAQCCDLSHVQTLQLKTIVLCRSLGQFGVSKDLKWMVFAGCYSYLSSLCVVFLESFGALVFNGCCELFHVQTVQLITFILCWSSVGADTLKIFTILHITYYCFSSCSYASGNGGFAGKEGVLGPISCFTEWYFQTVQLKTIVLCWSWYSLGISNWKVKSLFSGSTCSLLLAYSSSFWVLVKAVGSIRCCELFHVQTVQLKTNVSAGHWVVLAVVIDALG